MKDSVTKNHPSYNQIFEKLVLECTDETDRLIGKLAYSEYKLEKYQWKERVRESENISVIPAEQVKQFLYGYHENKLTKLRDESQETLFVFAELYAEMKIEEKKQEIQDGIIVKTIKSQKDGWFLSIFKGALGSLAFASVVFLLSAAFAVVRPESNYGKLISFVLGGKDFVVLSHDDPILKNSTQVQTPITN